MNWFWQIQLGTHDYIYNNGGPYGAPRYSDRLTYLSPSVVFGWRF